MGSFNLSGNILWFEKNVSPHIWPVERFFFPFFKCFFFFQKENEEQKQSPFSLHQSINQLDLLHSYWAAFSFISFYSLKKTASHLTRPHLSKSFFPAFRYPNFLPFLSSGPSFTPSLLIFTEQMLVNLSVGLGWCFCRNQREQTGFLGLGVPLTQPAGVFRFLAPIPPSPFQLRW